MKLVSEPQKYGPAARATVVKPSLRDRNPAIRTFGSVGKQVIVPDEMGFDFSWDGITSAISDTATKVYNQAITSGQTAATKYVQQQLVKIIGADGRPKEVPAGSPEAVAYQQQVVAQQQAAASAAAAPSNDPMMKYMLYGVAGVGGLIAIGLLWKIFGPKK